jgi:ABC-type multidrug transport system fused ATPase/permease subunit
MEHTTEQERSLLKRLIDSLGDGTYQEFIRDWKWIFSYSKKYWKIVLFYTLLGIVSSTLSLVSAVISKYSIDIITGYKTEQIGLLIFLMVGSMAFSLIFSSLVSRFSLKLDIYVHNDIQSEVFDRILDADWASLSGYPNGDLLNRFNSDVGTISGNAVSWIPNVIISVYSFLATFAVILHYNVTMAFITFLSAPILLGCSRILIKKNRMYQKRIMEMNSGMMSFETETFYNFDTIKSFGISSHYNKELRGWQKKYKQFQLDYNRFSILRNIFLSLLSAAIGFLAFAYCLYLLWTHAITYGTMTLFLSQRSSLSSSFSTLINILPGMINSTVSAQRIRELVDLPKETHDPATEAALAARAKDGFSMILRDVDFSYGEFSPEEVDSERAVGLHRTPVLRSCSFEAHPGEIVALIGESGQGKTTLLRLLLGLIRPGSGSACLELSDGNTWEINADVRRFFSYVPQGNTIISGTIAENLRMVKEDATDQELTDALEAAQALDFVQEMPDGINSRMGERGHGLSEGQSQRIAIARALLRDSPVLLLDEATSALDVATERQVLAGIMQNGSRTCIITTHRPAVLNICSRVYRISGQTLRELSVEEAIQSMYGEEAVHVHP